MLRGRMRERSRELGRWESSPSPAAAPSVSASRETHEHAETFSISLALALGRVLERFARFRADSPVIRSLSLGSFDIVSPRATCLVRIQILLGGRRGVGEGRQRAARSPRTILTVTYAWSSFELSIVVRTARSEPETNGRLCTRAVSDNSNERRPAVWYVYGPATIIQPNESHGRCSGSKFVRACLAYCRVARDRPFLPLPLASGYTQAR